jgi:hypothetical protein
MKFLIPLLILPFFIQTITAQNSGSVYFSPIYQNWTIADNGDFNELTNLLSVSYSPMRNTNMNLVTRYSMVGGDAEGLKGFSDTQFSLGYKIPSSNLILDGGISIPTGQTELSLEEFQTTQLISQSIFGMQTPSFGQGMNIFFGASYIIPVSKGFVLGAGLSYQIRSEYQPMKLVNMDYAPSDEITATAGLDVKLDEVSSLTGDLTGIF